MRIGLRQGAHHIVLNVQREGDVYRVHDGVADRAVRAEILGTQSMLIEADDKRYQIVFWIEPVCPPAWQPSSEVFSPDSVVAVVVLAVTCAGSELMVVAPANASFDGAVTAVTSTTRLPESDDQPPTWT